MKSGSSSQASVIASARTSRPSASVLPTSTGVPARVSMTSSGRIDFADTAFSAVGTRTRSLTGSAAVITAAARPSTVAAPPISFFISSMAFEGFRSRPPESKVIPLPIRVMEGPLSPQLMSIRRGATSAARPTVSMAGNSRSSASPDVTSMEVPKRPARSRAASSRPCGVMWFGGALMRSRHSAVPVASPAMRSRSPASGHAVVKSRLRSAASPASR